MLYATLTEIPKIGIPNEHGGSTVCRFDRASDNPPQLRPAAARPGQYRPNLVAVVAFYRLGVGTTWRTWSSELVARKATSRACRHGPTLALEHGGRDVFLGCAMA
jgi:hypothetical protein